VAWLSLSGSKRRWHVTSKYRGAEKSDEAAGWLASTHGGIWRHRNMCDIISTG